MKIVKLTALFCVGILAFTACKDKEDPPATNNGSSKSRKELITLKNWKISSLITSNTDIWGTAFVESCNKDNQYKFRSDDSLVLYDMSSKCSPSDPDSSTSMYKLYNGDKQIILNVKLTSSITVKDTADIVTLDENTLQLNAEYSGLPATITFKHP